MSTAAPRQLALVTGASSGIGAEIAELLAAAGYDLVLTARRLDRLMELAGRLSVEYGISCTPLAADLAQTSECERVTTTLATEKHRLAILVNNAGFGSQGLFHELPCARDLEMIDVNCRALTHLTKGILPWMIANRRGRILNVASVASFQPGPLMAVYYASKAFVLSLSEALSNECEGTGVTVTATCPGPTVTEFSGVAGFGRTAPTSGAPAMSAKVVARLSVDAMMRGARVVVTGSSNRFVVVMSQWLPRIVVLRVVRAIQARRSAAKAMRP